METTKEGDSKQHFPENSRKHKDLSNPVNIQYPSAFRGEKFSFWGQLVAKWTVNPRGLFNRSLLIPKKYFSCTYIQSEYFFKKIVNFKEAMSLISILNF